MQFKGLFLVPLFWSAVADAKTSTATKCYTQLGTKSLKNVPTSTLSKASTSTLSPILVKITTHPTAVATAPAGTQTITSTSISTTTVTNSARTDTAVVTSTSISVTTVEETSHVPSTTIVTQSSTTVSTSVVPAPSGFLYISDTANPGSAGQVKRETSSHVVERRVGKSLNKPVAKVCREKYPQRVECKKTVIVQNTVTSTVKGSATTTTKTPTPISTTVTTTLTATSTVIPDDVSVTSTVKTTIINTETSTKTMTDISTSTTTVVATQTATSYEACGSRNMFGPINDIDQIYFEFQSSLGGIAYGESSAYNCCVACLTRNGCYNGIFSSSGGSSGCQLFYNQEDMCPRQVDAPFSFTRAAQSAYSDTLFNGPCGYFHPRAS